jgi:hypothetical protein
VNISTGETKLRKLRKSAGEKVVSGADYSSRLRDQFEKVGAERFHACRSAFAITHSRMYALTDPWRSAIVGREEEEEQVLAEGLRWGRG